MRALSAAYPAIVNMPEGQQGGPLYVNTTSAGPRGHIYKNEREKKYISPGYSAIELLNNGTIQNLTFRFPRDKPKTAAAVLKTTDIPKPKEPDKPMESVNASFLGEEWINLDERLQVPQDNIVVEAYLSDIPFAK